MSSYSARILEDEERPYVVFAEALSREIGWGVGATVQITGNRNCFKIELLEKGIQENRGGLELISWSNATWRRHA